MSSFPNELRPALLVPPLLKWFAQNARLLPWRRNADPYGIWISEIMLQQTQVKTVIPYWERWMALLPDLKSLAAAPLDGLYKQWEGLGYYTRLRNIHHAARVIVEKHGGRFPDTFDDILNLPGIGPYTAGAIASIAFNQPRPILDGNVMRLFSRVFAIEENVRAAPTQKRLWALAEEFIQGAAKLRTQPPNVCSQANQSLMELGATICTPRQPKCASCPIRRYCRAFREGRTALLPNLGIRPSSIRREMIAFVIECRLKFLVARRPAKAVNGGLWEFPNADLTGSVSMETGAQQFFSPENLSFEPLIEVSHTIMRHRIRLKVFRAKVKQRIQFRTKEEYRWASRAELAELAFPSAHRSIVSALARCRGETRFPAESGRADKLNTPWVYASL